MVTALAEPASTTGLAARTGIPVSTVSEHLERRDGQWLSAACHNGPVLALWQLALPCNQQRPCVPAQGPDVAGPGVRALPSNGVKPLAEVGLDQRQLHRGFTAGGPRGGS